MRPEESPDFYATASYEAIPDYMFRNSDLSIESEPPLVIDTNRLQTLEWAWKPYWMNDSIEVIEAPAGQKYFHISQQISVLAFKRDTKENLFYGILNPGYYTTTIASGMARHFEMRTLLSKYLPESHEGVSNLKPGMIGLYIRILTDNGISYYPYVVNKPIRNSPAEKAGLQSSDVIIEVDGSSTLNKSYLEVVKMIRGPIGDKVHLQILRENIKMSFDLERLEASFLGN
ncbi:MAG: PDZ domain-containing protein [Ignavibacteriota bacterium]